MKVQSVILGFAALASSHSIFQKVSVNGVDQGQLKGVRAPDSDYPIQNVNDAAFACNKNLKHLDSTIITVPAGAKVGPIMVYLAKVDNAATAQTTGLKWFKVAEDGLSNGQWAVDKMIANNGWHYFNMPRCIAPVDYLMRVELIALHGAQMQGQARFYMECAQIRITGSGTNSGSNFVSFPGAYKANDPGIQVNIYDNSGNPYMGGKTYKIPGPPALTC
ncbi:glycoside hydrolase family 61 protein [Hypoxylon sp. FL0890]|nr:glycoside hydrolase family 61 protein [Hypoxylon sp. FL0890]